MKKLLFIVNPMAGKGAYKTNFGETLYTLHAGGIVPTVRFTAGRGDATAIAEAEGADYDVVCCLGGDGTLSEVMEGIVRLPKITKYHARVEYDNGVLEDDFLFGGVMNSTSVAGLIHLNSDKIRLDDGLFELALVKSPKNIADLRAILTDLRERTYDGRFIKLVPTSFARFTFTQPVAWTRDGEDGGSFEQIELRNLNRAVKIIV